MRTKIWAKMLSLLAVVFAVTFTACEPTEEQNASKLEVQSTLSLDAAGKEVTVKVTSSSEFTATTSDAWIQIGKTTKSNVRISAEPNNAEAARTGEVVLVNQEGTTAKIAVTQSGSTAHMDVTPAVDTVSVAAAGETVEFAVATNQTITASADQEWVEVEWIEASKKVVVEVAENATFEAREATLTIAATETLTKSIVIKQAGLEYSLVVEAEGLEEGAVVVPSTEAELTLSVEANAAWTLAADAEWVVLDVTEFTAAEDEAVVIFGDNTNPADRTAKLTLTCGTAVQEITVTQRGAGVYIEFDAKYAEYGVGSEATVVEIPVKTNAENIIVTAAEGWVSGRYSSDKKVVSLDVSENDAEAREITVTLTGSMTGAPNGTATIVIKQAQYAENLAVNADGFPETANTYAIYKSGAYKFPATVKGNGAGFYNADGYELEVSYVPGSSTDIEADKIYEATQLWSSRISVDELTGEKNGMLTDITYADGYVYFTMPEPFEPGNSGIAIKNKKGEILWSWHIWATPFDINAAEHTYPIGQTPDSMDDPEEGEEMSSHTTGYAKSSVFMGLNLGATHDGNHGDCTPDELFESFGFMYNWGRKDPFPAVYPTITEVKDGGANAIIYYIDQDIDLPEEITAAESTEATMYSSKPLFGGINDNIDWAIAHPTVYLYSVGTYGDNCIYSNLPTDYGQADPNQNSSTFWGYLWGNYSSNSGSEGSKSLHDPCPPGWQVPCGDHWHIITSHGDNIGPYYGSYAPWKYNVQEAAEMWENAAYDGFDPNGFWPWATKVNDAGATVWNSDAQVNFMGVEGIWKGGFNVFTGVSNRTVGNGGENAIAVTDENAPDGSSFTLAEGQSKERKLEPLSAVGTKPMFVPAVGWRMGYNPNTIKRPGTVCRYHLNQPSNLKTMENLGDVTWTKYQAAAMSMWPDGNFFRNSAVSYAEWQGNGHPVRCVKPVVVEVEPVE